jgi:nitrate/nitrite transporter NarK
VLCIFLAKVHKHLGATICFLMAFSLFVKSSAGATFSIVPFVSRRALGAVSGLVGAGGDFGGVLTQVRAATVVHFHRHDCLVAPHGDLLTFLSCQSEKAHELENRPLC